MSGPAGSQHWMYASGGFYDYSIENSVRMSDANNTTLQWTAGTPSNGSIFTMSVWMKKYNPSGGQATNEFFSSGPNGVNYMFISFNSNQRFYFDGGVGQGDLYWGSGRRFRDPNAWFHLVLRGDTTQSTQADRLKLYLNGEDITSEASTKNMAASAFLYINASGQSQNWGGKTGVANGNPGCDYYLADINFCDGQSYAPTEFGETKGGVWVPKDPSVTYGNNGYRLEFKQTGTGGASATTIGADTSGNDNHFTDSGFASEDVVPDSPTNNWSTNNRTMRANITQSEGNLKMVGVGTNYDNMASTFTFDVEDSEGWYWEYRSIGNNNDTTIGISTPQNSEFNQSDPTNPFSNTTACVSYNGDGQKKIAGTNSSYGNSWTAGDIIGIAVKAGAVYFYKNGTIQNSGTAAVTGLTGQYVAAYALNGTHSGTANYGQDSTFAGTETAASNSDTNGFGEFSQTVPSGYKALCSANLPELDIGPNSNTQADDYFNTVLYTGNASTNAITGVGFQPDWVWIKNRTDVVDHVLTDAVRGATIRLESNSTDTETTQTEDLQSFDADGFTVGNQNRVNGSSDAIVAWNWKAGGSSNTFNIDGTGYADMSSAGLTDGTIALSGLSANTTSGFSVATFTMTSGNSTLAHGLGTEPDLLIFKRRAGSASSWVVWARPFGENTKSNLLLDGTAAAGSSGSGNWIQNITNTLVGIGDYGNMAAAGTHVMYAFASVDGHSKVGSYIGNGNADGTFVYTGFRPAWVMVRRSSSTGGWHIFDNKRPNAYNEIDKRLEADNTDAENSTSGCKIDLVSNGFKFRGTFDNINGSGATHIYLAFAEAPFKYANAR